MRRTRRLALFLVPLGLSIACTSITDGTATQCRSEEDCRRRGPEFADTTCSIDRVCVPVKSEDVQCSTNQECSEKNGGAPFRCVPQTKRCVALTSPECSILLGEKQDWLSDQAIFIGMSQHKALDGTLQLFGADLARSEIRLALGGGLPAITPGGPKRPMVIISCPVEPAPAGGFLSEVMRGWRYLSGEVKIDAAMPLLSQTVTAATPEVLIPNGVPTIATASATPIVVSTYQDRDLVFQMGATDTDQVPLLQSFLTDHLTPRVYADNIAPAGTPIRVQLVYASDAANGNTADAIIKTLKWNEGKSTVENGANFLATDVGDSTDKVGNPNFNARIVSAISAARTFQPHIVIMALAPALGATFMVPLETQWPAGVPRPLFVSTLAAWANSVSAQIGSRDALRKRYYGLEPVSAGFDQARFDEFAIALRIKFPEMLNQNLGPQTYYAYDAIYALAHAIVSAGATQLNGDVIVRGLRRLGTGPAVNANPTDLTKGFAALQSGGSISLQGISGPLNFDEGGKRKFDAQVFCVKGTNGVASGIVRPGYKYVAATQTVTGTVNCP